MVAVSLSASHVPQYSYSVLVLWTKIHNSQLQFRQDSQETFSKMWRKHFLNGIQEISQPEHIHSHIFIFLPTFLLCAVREGPLPGPASGDEAGGARGAGGQPHVRGPGSSSCWEKNPRCAPLGTTHLPSAFLQSHQIHGALARSRETPPPGATLSKLVKFNLKS